MSALIFELTDNHIKLLKELRWSMVNGIISGVGNEDGDITPPFNTDSIYEAIDLILNGKRFEIDPMKTDEVFEYSDEEIKEWDKLYNELPTALDIVLNTGKFEAGTYKTRYHIRNWIKIS